MSRPGFLLQVAITSHYTLGSNSLSKIQLCYVIFENRLEKMTSPEFAVSAAPPGRIIFSYHSNQIYKLHNKRHLPTIRFPTARKAGYVYYYECKQRTGIPLIYLFIYYFPTIKITQALHYTKMWRGDLRKPQGLYEEAPSLQ